MALPVRGAHVLAADVRVDFRGRDVDVPEHGLHTPEIGPALDQVCGETMPQQMRIRARVDPRCSGVASYDLPKSLPRERLAARVGKHHSHAF